ncbi:MAG: hypothetical protein HY913_15580 [Desulfomonile tiedjei]|nr:hypothetical protein [Desulfomonile tiedjei]
MRYTRMFAVVGFITVAAVALLFSSVYAQQTSGNSPSAATSAVLQTDTVVNPHGSAIQAPVTNVHWRGFRGGRFYGARFHSGFYAKPYLYRSYPYSYRSYTYRPYNCWWNGIRWVCPKKLIIY